MLILGSLVNENGYVFHRSDRDLFIVETTLPNAEDAVSYIFIDYIFHENKLTNLLYKLNLNH